MPTYSRRRRKDKLKPIPSVLVENGENILVSVRDIRLDAKSKSAVVYVQNIEQIEERERKILIKNLEEALAGGVPTHVIPPNIDQIRIALEHEGYQVTIAEWQEPEYFYAPTADHVAQKIYTADKRGNFLADLMALRRQREQTTPIMDSSCDNVIGFKVEISIPSKKAHEGHIQLAFDFDFQEEGGFKLIPRSELKSEETREKLTRLIEGVERQIAKDLSPLTLRIKDAILCLAQDKQVRKFDYAEEDLLDLLYKREKRKTGGEYHRSPNKKRVREQLQLISKMRLTFAIRIGKEIRGVEDIPYIILNPEGKPFIKSETSRGKQKLLKNFGSIEIPERYWDLCYSAKYIGQFNRAALQLQGTKYLLYKYLATWWRIEWIKKHGVYQWVLDDILLDAGITTPTRANTARFIKGFTQDLQEMKKRKIIGGFRRLKKNKDPLRDVWRFEAPKELKARLGVIGQEYKERRELKELTMERKKLKYMAEIKELKGKIGR